MDVDRESAELITDACSSWRPICGAGVGLSKFRETVRDRPGAGWHRLPGGRDVRGDRLTARGLHAHVVLHRRLEHPRFSRVDVSAPNHRVHYFRTTQVSNLNEDMAA